MSVRTVADERLAEARDHLNQAIKALADIVVNQCSGYDEWNAEFQSKMRESLAELINVREEIG